MITVIEALKVCWELADQNKLGYRRYELQEEAEYQQSCLDIAKAFLDFWIDTDVEHLEEMLKVLKECSQDCSLS